MSSNGKTLYDQAADAANAAADKIKQAGRSVSNTVAGQTEESKPDINRNPGSGQSLEDEAKHASVLGNKARTPHSQQ